MTTATEQTTTTTTITGALDALAQSLAEVPGRHPHDAQIGSPLLHLASTGIQNHGDLSRMILATLERRGVDADEARAVAQALQGLALRLGAWLGRAR